MDEYRCVCWQCRSVEEYERGYEVLEWVKEHWGHDVTISSNGEDEVWRSKDNE